MKRSEFLKRLGIGTAAVIAAPQILKALPGKIATSPINGAEVCLFCDGEMIGLGDLNFDVPEQVISKESKGWKYVVEQMENNQWEVQYPWNFSKL